jgi:hypothetical protein
MRVGGTFLPMTSLHAPAPGPYLMLAGMVVIAWWQWDTAERFRERLAALEDRMEKQTVYYRVDENGEEKNCDY